MTTVDKNAERVLVVPTAEFHKLGLFQGFSPEANRYMYALLNPGIAEFRPRGEVEDDPGFKQLIPYSVLRWHEYVFAYIRGVCQGESRLHALRSLGIGGHISEADAGVAASYTAYTNGMNRELEEEVTIYHRDCTRDHNTIDFVGLINDDSNPVGQVHLGIVNVFELDDPLVTPNEDGLLRAGFMPINRARELKAEFETWSQIVIDNVL